VQHVLSAQLQSHPAEVTAHFCAIVGARVTVAEDVQPLDAVQSRKGRDDAECLIATVRDNAKWKKLLSQ
jgi:hypothetical protein